jgi:hypothetical protein
MNKLFLTICLLFSFQAFASDKITFLVPFPPGGTTDQTLQIIRPLLEEKGHRVEIKFLKSCSEALNILHRDDENVFLNLLSSNFEPFNNDAQCKMNAETDGVVLFSSINENPSYICTSPGIDISKDDFFNKPIKMGYVSDAQIIIYLRYFLNHTLLQNQITLVPYRGGGQIVKAALAKDIDIWFGGSPLRKLKDLDIKCFGSTLKNNLYDFPFIGHLTDLDNNLMQFSFMNILWAKQHTVSDSVKQSFQEVFSDKQFIDYLDSLGSVHTGLGVTENANEQLFELKNQAETFKNLESVVQKQQSS